MRLAFLTHEPFYPPSGGGSAEALYLVRELLRRGHEVHVFAPSGPPLPSALGAVRLHPFRTFAMGRRTALRNLKYALFPFVVRRALRRAHRRTPFALIVGQHSIAALAVGALRRELGVPVVLNFLDHLSGFMEAWPAWRVPRPLLRWLMGFELSLPRRYGVDGVLSVSEELAGKFVARGFPAAQVRTIRYGFDPGGFPYAPRRPEGPPLIAMHGSFDLHHLGRLARDTLCAILDRRPAVRFRFVGPRTRPLRRMLADVRRRHPEASLEATGFVPYGRLEPLLAEAHLGLIPYEASAGSHAAFLAKAVELLALGVPFLCTRLRTMVDAFGKRPGAHFADFRPEALADAACALLAGPPTGLEETSRWVHETLRWEVVARAAADFLEACAQRTGSVSSVVPAGSS